MKMDFDRARCYLDGEFTDTKWINGSGLSEEELIASVKKLEETISSKAVCKAKTFEFIAYNAPIAIDTEDIFQDKLMGAKIMVRQRKDWDDYVKQTLLPEETAKMRRMWKQCGAYLGTSDYGHTSPNTELMLKVGLVGLLQRVDTAAMRDGLSEKQKEFYLSCHIALESVIHVAKRLSEAIAPYNRENASALENIARSAPENTYEAMQLLVLYFFMHDYVCGTRVRTLGRLDALLYPFYKRDIESGRYTKEEISEMLKYFLYKFWVAKVPFDLPFCIGGTDTHGEEITNEMSYMIVNAYSYLDIYSPKIHVRVSEKTPASFVKLILSCIRDGKSSFVFVNEKIGIKALTQVGIEEGDARNFVPIGCYEPAVWGVEIGCSDNGGVNLAKAVEAVFNRGKDLRSGELCGIDTDKISSYDEFLAAIKAQIRHMTEQAMSYIRQIERHYGEINPDPLLSSQYDRSVERGVDVYEGGAKYNNSSLYFYSIASLVDSVCAVKKLVFDEKRYSFEELGEILRKNWEDHEKDRATALRLPEKYGNQDPLADSLSVEFSEYFAELVNNKPNSRGGVFKAAMYTIDQCFYLGERTMATPDGRKAGETLSKNLCATVGMDRHGITALINSATKIDHSKFPTGSVLDIMLHPSAVSGDEGLDAFYSIILTYFARGGFAIHGNVFDSSTLKKAQKDPQNYRNLQVRVCGWNAYFINLTKAEQNAFIKQAESIEGRL
ncbi:MAG: hypothetical protein E7641_06880 [Ruminococcaceae bacterium]|nr:hypothetical protein [Oscillospiraceae bacterium]